MSREVVGLLSMETLALLYVARWYTPVFLFNLCGFWKMSDLLGSKLDPLNKPSLKINRRR